MTLVAMLNTQEEAKLSMEATGKVHGNVNGRRDGKPVKTVDFFWAKKLQDGAKTVRVLNVKVQDHTPAAS